MLRATFHQRFGLLRDQLLPDLLVNISEWLTPRFLVCSDPEYCSLVSVQFDDVRNLPIDEHSVRENRVDCGLVTTECLAAITTEARYMLDFQSGLLSDRLHIGLIK